MRDRGSIPGSGGPLENGMVTHFSILACRIPGREEPGGLQFMGSQGVGHDWATNFTIASHRIFLVHMLMTMLQWGRGVIISSLQMRLKKINN